MHYCSFKIFKTFIFQRSVLNIGSCSSLYDSQVYCSQDCTQECAWARVRRMLPLGGLAWKHSEKLLCSTRGGITEKGKSNKGLGGIELNQSRIPSGLLLVNLHPALVVEPGGMSMVPVSVRDRLSLTREGKLSCKICLHPHLE